MKTISPNLCNLLIDQDTSTETTLLYVQNYILRAVDDHKAAALVLLDTSAAFDTVSNIYSAKLLMLDLKIWQKHTHTNTSLSTLTFPYVSYFC